MKKVHIVILLLVAVTVGGILFMTGDYSTYANFIQAKEKTNKSVNVVGFLAKDKPLNYDPQKDPNYFSFTMRDEQGN
jgi:cytochrome c-type biogenesis protein CcmE